ncbi:MAG: bifunctional phosphoribosylaminoimidazolecarboxamide formyltransferase/IMP cyclohydrolase [Candidatus Omnitrophota bacterium]
MVKVKRALISVSDKTGIVDLAKVLSSFGVEIISTGGTARALKEAGIPVVEMSDYTGFPEMLDGRVKTLHPKIHGGLLSLRDNADHMKQIAEHAIGLIDMVVVNLYPFEKTIQKEGVHLEEAIENIDIGGPSMLRSASKNYRSVAVVSSAKFYPAIIEELKKNKGSITDPTLAMLAVEVFKLTSCYDGAIAQYLSVKLTGKQEPQGELPQTLNLNFKKVSSLRYGENPHQKAALYQDEARLTPSLITARQLHGKELSFNNYLDLHAALDIVRDFKNPASCVIKHNNPTGVAEASDLAKAFADAWATDSLSAFGGIVGFNRKVDQAVAKKILKSGFLECILAPGYEGMALEILKGKKNMRLLQACFDIPKSKTEVDLKKIDGGLLVQEPDLDDFKAEDLKVATKTKPTQKQLASLLFAWSVVRHVKSNAIVLAQGTKTVGIGMGQTSRVDSVHLAIKRAGKKSKGSVMASDAFFPKADNIALAKKAGVKAIIQPGGSISDDEVIAACNKAKIAMVFTGVRHFKH